MGTKRKQNRRSPKTSRDLNGLLVLELQEIHSTEAQLARVMPQLAKTVESASLRKVLERRVATGERVMKDAASALKQANQTPGRKKNLAAEGLINDVRDHAQQLAGGPARDAMMISGMQKSEHYCVAAWGTAAALAQAAGQKSTVKAMQRALKDGKAPDEQLTRLAAAQIMPQVLSHGEATELEDEGTQIEARARERSQKNGAIERRATR